MGFRPFFRFLYFERTRPTASMRPPSFIYLSASTEAMPRQRSDRGRLLPSGKKPLHTRVRKGWQYFNSLSVCVAFVVFTDCESRTRPISTNPASIEACKHGLTLGMCFITWEVVPELLWISWCVSGAAGCFPFFVFLLMHTACCKYEATLPHLPLY